MHACRFHEDNNIPHTFHITIPTGTFYSTYSTCSTFLGCYYKKQASDLF